MSLHMRGALFVVIAMLVTAACGSMSRISQPAPSPSPPRASIPPGAPTPDPNGPRFLTVVLKPGADPRAVGDRIAGVGATVQQAPQVAQENLPQTILRRTYRVSLVKGQELEALRIAQSDPQVLRTYLGEYPGQYPEP
jgi:hypothetical protein